MRIVSLFTGVGGLDFGLEGGFEYLGKRYESNGLKTVFACDIKPSAKKVFDAYQKKRLRHTTLTLASIVDLVKEHQNGKRTFPEADIVIGGFPCQDFSHCGKRGGFKSHKNHLNQIIADIPTEETRGMLYFWMMRTIQEIRPKLFIAENVKGLLTKKVSGFTAIDRIRSDFGAMRAPRYKVDYKMVNAKDYGVPQNRERTIIVGVREDVAEEFCISDPKMLIPMPDIGFGITCGMALADLEEPSQTMDLSQKAFSKAAYITNGQGQTEIPLEDVGPTIRSEHHGNIEFRRLAWAHGGKHSSELDAGLPERRLTVRECARLQSFPDDMEFLPHVSASEAYKLIGNAVPPVMGHAIGRQVVACLAAKV